MTKCKHRVVCASQFLCSPTVTHTQTHSALQRMLHRGTVSTGVPEASLKKAQTELLRKS